MATKEASRIKFYGLRDVSKRGRSLSITIPKEVTEHLGISDGDVIAFYCEEKPDRMYVTKVVGIKTSDGQLISPEILSKRYKKEINLCKKNISVL
jgi:bifunctional DNA-binding transcriptional regulator/antitoxin component of YhaV-PrlF toxin-antitoxin module